MPRGPGMLRKDLLRANGPIFTEQGKALNQVAKRDVKVLVVGNPANTNCYIAQKNAPDLSPACFSAMVRLDQNRAKSQVADKLGCPVAQVKKLIIWGNHSATQYPDLFNAEVEGSSVAPQVNDVAWIKESFIPKVQQRGKEIIEARGKSSAASAASAAIDHVREWHLGTPPGDYSAMAVYSEGQYGAPKGVFFGFPCRCEGGQAQVVEGLPIDDFSRPLIEATGKELQEESEAVADLV